MCRSDNYLSFVPCSVVTIENKAKQLWHFKLLPKLWTSEKIYLSCSVPSHYEAKQVWRVQELQDPVVCVQFWIRFHWNVFAQSTQVYILHNASQLCIHKYILHTSICYIMQVNYVIIHWYFFSLAKKKMLYPRIIVYIWYIFKHCSALLMLV